jgi:hypothetical protein
MSAPVRVGQLVLDVSEGDPSERLTCLLCHVPAEEVGSLASLGEPRCEYEVRFLTPKGSAVAGLHKRCYERAMLAHRAAT